MAASNGVNERPAGSFESAGRLELRHRVQRGVPGAVGRARRFVRRALERWRVAGQVVEQAVLTASELVSNAIKHGEGAVELVIQRMPTAIRIVVWDGSSLPPLVRPPLATGTGGRGMEVVARSSARWGYEIHEAGKSVWAEFSLVPRSA